MSPIKGQSDGFGGGFQTVTSPVEKGLRGATTFFNTHVRNRTWNQFEIIFFAVSITVIDVLLVSFWRFSSGHLLVERYPHLTNSVQGAALVFAGDILSQSFVQWRKGLKQTKLNWNRLTKAGVVGIVNVGLWPYYWYKLVDMYLPNQAPLDLPFPVFIYEWGLLAVKIGLDGLINGVFSIVSSFTLWSIMDKDSYTLWKNKLSALFFQTWKMDWKAWPMYNVVCFSLIPLRLRPMTNGLASMLWNAYISHQSQSVAVN